MSESQEKTTITACIDGSVITNAIVDTAAWASNLLDSPLRFLHVLEKAETPITDRSGAIGPGSASHLLDELTELDEKRGKIAMELGKHMLADAEQRACDAGVADVTLHQRHGDLLDALLTCESNTSLFVIGRMGADHENEIKALGAQFESLIRAIHTPTLVTVGAFSPPASFMIAYDGSDTADKAIAGIANTDVLKSMCGHVVMVGADNEQNQQSLRRACELLTSSGHDDIKSHLRQGNVVEALTTFRDEHEIGLLVMGAYGHSRVRDFFVGSNTSKMISHSVVPLLLLR
ncbi:MAG: universal stress protein [Gammaproteobacteria bacterium]